MSFEDRNCPKFLSDLVFKDPTVQQAIQSRSLVTQARNMLFYGKAGAGKSATCRMLAGHLTGYNWACVTTINVSSLSAKDALTNAIAKQSLANTWNPLERGVIILEELDGASHAAQLALKATLDKQAKFSLFLGTTNDITGIAQPIRDRFEIHHMERPGPLEWASRAQQILADEGHIASIGMVQNLLVQKAPEGTSMRDVMRVLQDQIATTVAANTPILQTTNTVSP